MKACKCNPLARDNCPGNLLILMIFSKMVGGEKYNKCGSAQRRKKSLAGFNGMNFAQKCSR